MYLPVKLIVLPLEEYPTMQKVNSLDAFLTKKKKTFIVSADTIRVLVPAMYAERGLLTVERNTSTLGVVKVIINNKAYLTLMMTTMLEMSPSSTTDVTIDEYKYVALDFVRGDTFIVNSSIIKDAATMYQVFVTFVRLGKIPPFIQYKDIISLFDNSEKLCGLRFGVNHSNYEVLFSHMYRDAKDPFLAYRYTKMEDDPVVVSLNKISHGPSSASARVIGSYMNEGMVSSLIHDNDHPSAVENLLRA